MYYHTEYRRCDISPETCLTIQCTPNLDSTLYFTAQNNDRKLGMPTTQASHKNEIWNVMYDIQINYDKTSESD